ncbi:hypothetical protein RSJ21_19755 (plasmid) [Clostridium botulinum]|uniref:flavodoxin family protein n=3 Tax=Clostridium botulinum TaxID=1491 RepID=UPI000A1728CE|nr:flavodoxin family protein [Clostridium botulinum]AUN12747.1 hypothetical protein RSJ6_20085 [Clostridium botulinum]AUN19940.1 hypothetical protein RSJ22_00005 [Clostridium botulinum]AUN27429.1 hypothetical protein RSJ21_19755 [Clostridium botulinum]NFM32725.1 flavodoxin family protein [Clostridium botulinum]OSA65799.1 hypothetical protein B2H87_19420 [Clostridium botulinum]
MKKIFVYVGSRKKIKSNTLTFIKLTLDKLCFNDKNNISYDIYTPNNSCINNCLGCSECFDIGRCPQDKMDDMKILRNKMIEADFIIFATPIYAISVSGDMKCFIDRISSWTHIMKLSGKPAIALTTSNGNGTKYTLEYLYMIMSHLGLDVVRQIDVNIFDYKQFDDPYVQSQCQECAKIIYNYLFGKEKVKSNEALEKIFRLTQKKMLLYEKALNEKKLSENDLPYEYIYWKDNNYFDLNKFQDMLEKK